MSSITTLMGGRVITCIIPSGRGREIIDKLYQEKQQNTAILLHARGVSEVSGGLNWEMGDSLEKDIITLNCSDDEADEMFTYLYDIAEIDRPHGGIIYMQALRNNTPYVLPEITHEE